MFAFGFEKTAEKYSHLDHYIESEELDAKHIAKMEKLHRGKATAVGAGVGGLYGAVIGAAASKPTRHLEVVRNGSKAVAKKGILSKITKSRTGKGAAIGAGLGGLAGLGLGILQHRAVEDAGKVSKMDPQERRGYLRAQYEHLYGRDK